MQFSARWMSRGNSSIGISRTVCEGQAPSLNTLRLSLMGSFYRVAMALSCSWLSLLMRYSVMMVSSD